MTKLCGIRPSGKLHLGHYFSVIKPARQGCDVLLAHLHCPKKEREQRHGVERELRKFGIMTEEQEVNDELLYFRLLELAKIGELSLMTQFKSSKEKNAHLLTYPVLMAYDVIGYDEVWVGEDQRQHLEFARELIKRYNKEYKEYYGEKIKIPKAKIVGGRIMDLSNPTKKMSSSSPKGCLFLSDSDEEIRHKIKKAVSNEAGLKNLKVLYDEFVGGEYPKMNSELKEKLSEGIIRVIKNRPHPER